MSRNEQSTTLLLAISDTATKRQRHRASLSAQTARNMPSRPWNAEEEETDEGEARSQAKRKIAQLHKSSLERYRIDRYKSSLRNQLSRAQVDDAVLCLTDTPLVSLPLHSTSTSTSSSSKPDDDDDLCEKLSALSKQVVALWNANQSRIRMALPRYFEGYPVRERIQPPLFRPRRTQKPSGLGDCLQCLAKGLPCSMSVVARGEGEGVVGRGCRRCVADGDRCIIEHEVEDVDGEKGRKGEVEREREESGLWDWWDGVPDRHQDVDSAAEAIEMWERRRKGMKLELIGGCMLWVESRGFAPRGMIKTCD